MDEAELGKLTAAMAQCSYDGQQLGLKLTQMLKAANAFGVREQLKAAQAAIPVIANDVWSRTCRFKAQDRLAAFAAKHGWEHAIIRLAEKPGGFGLLRGWALISDRREKALAQAKLPMLIMTGCRGQGSVHPTLGNQLEVEIALEKLMASLQELVEAAAMAQASPTAHKAHRDKAMA